MEELANRIAAAAIGLSLLTAAVPLQAQQRCDATTYALSSPTSRFEDHGDGTVTDVRSNLMWMRCSAGQTWSAATCQGSAALLSLNAARQEATAVNKHGSFFYSDWRVPQVPELATIAERQCKNPRINLAIFPNTPADGYWTVTSRQPGGHEPFAFVLSFGDDGVKYESEQEKHRVRLVRTAP